MNEEQHWPKDYFGNVFEVGDIVAYPVRFGASMTMHHAEILYINRGKYTEEHRQRPGYEHIKPVFKLRVKILGWGETYMTPQEQLDQTEKPSETTLERLSRMINITKLQGNSQVVKARS